MIRVMANGCFDLLHPGHVAHLHEARSMGDYLIVSLTLDVHVGKGPGRPIYTWADRAALLRELRCVDQVVPTANAVDAIRMFRPDIFVKGADYAPPHGKPVPEAAVVEAYGGRVEFIRLVPGRSSSETIARLR